MASSDTLFEPTSLGELQLSNRIIYPAMTRARCAGRVLNSENVEYYAARASAGMVVTEPSAVSALANGFLDAPGLYTEEQARGWASVTRALHDKGCTVVCQLWHTGRMSHSSFRDGATPVAPSAIGVVGVNGVPACGVQGADGKWHEHELPVEMSAADIDEVVASFGRAAALAKAAGFDGIEVHAGSGYLLDTFLQACSNARTDKYGGSAERRFTILGEVLVAVSASFSMSRVGVKLTPNNGFNGMGSVDAYDTFMHVASRLDALGIAYLHVTDGVGQSAPVTWYGRVSSSGFHGCSAPLSLRALKSAFRGALVGNGGYTAESAAAAIAAGEAAAISFGRVYMSNPDLVARFRDELPLTPLPPKDEWFVPSEATKADLSKGYTEYKAYSAAASPKRLSSPVSVYTTFVDVDGESSGAWRALEHELTAEGARTGVLGAMAAHTCPDREAAARKLISNHVRVLHDLTNSSTSTNIDNKALTQPFTLRRVAPEHRALVDGFLRELARRLLGDTSMLLEERIEAKQPLQAAAWVASASFLDGRIQSTAEQMPGRKPDMSPAAAAAMRAVMAEMRDEAAPLAVAAPSVLALPPSEPASPEPASPDGSGVAEAAPKVRKLAAA